MKFSKAVVMSGLFGLMLTGCDSMETAPSRHVVAEAPKKATPAATKKTPAAATAPNHAPTSTNPIQEFVAHADYYDALTYADQNHMDLPSANEWIDTKLSREEVTKLSETLNKSEWRARCLLRSGQYAILDHDLSSARSLLGKSVNAAPGSDPALKAQDLLGQIEALRKVEPKTIGLALPLTGKFASVGQKTLRGVQMGLGLSGDNVTSFRLAIVDTEGNPDSARKGVDQLVQQDNVIAIIGSVLSKTAPAVASRAAELGVPSITLSQKNGVTELGPAVFRNALTSEMQVHQLAKTAMKDQGLKRFAILYPNDQYGVEYANLFWDEVLARGGTVVAAQSYSPKETDFRYVVQRLVGTYYLEDRAEEYKARLKDWSQGQTKRGANRNTPPDDLLPPVMDFDAVFIPDDSKALGQISAMLSYNNVKGVKLLGTNLWNVQGLSKRAGSFSKDLIFVDSFISSDPQFQNSTFVKDFKNTFNEEPGAFEIQGYDSAMLIRQLVMSGQSSREGLSAALSQVQDFTGAIGKISMLPNHELLRPMVALTLDSGEIVPLKAR